MSSQSQCSVVVLLYPVQGSAGALTCRVQGSVGVWCSVVGLFCYYPGSGFAEETAGRPAPAAAVSGASGLGVAPQAPAIYTPEYRNGQVEPKPLTERLLAKLYHVFPILFMGPFRFILFGFQNIYTDMQFRVSSPGDLHERNAL